MAKSLLYRSVSDFVNSNLVNEGTLSYERYRRIATLLCGNVRIKYNGLKMQSPRDKVGGENIC